MYGQEDFLACLFDDTAVVSCFFSSVSIIE